MHHQVFVFFRARLVQKKRMSQLWLIIMTIDLIVVSSSSTTSSFLSSTSSTTKATRVPDKRTATVWIEPSAVHHGVVLAPAATVVIAINYFWSSTPNRARIILLNVYNTHTHRAALYTHTHRTALYTHTHRPYGIPCGFLKI